MGCWLLDGIRVGCAAQVAVVLCLVQLQPRYIQVWQAAEPGSCTWVHDASSCSCRASSLLE